MKFEQENEELIDCISIKIMSTSVLFCKLFGWPALILRFFFFFFFILISFPFSSLSFYHTKLYKEEERYNLCLTELLISCSTALQFKSFKSYHWKVVNSRQTKYESIVMTATTWDNIAIPLPCLSGVKNI